MQPLYCERCSAQIGPYFGLYQGRPCCQTCALNFGDRQLWPTEQLFATYPQSAQFDFGALFRQVLDHPATPWVIGLGLLLLAAGDDAPAPPQRNTRKYVLRHGATGDILHGGITTRALYIRWLEHQRRWPGSYIEQVGRVSTAAGSHAWEAVLNYGPNQHPRGQGTKGQAPVFAAQDRRPPASAAEAVCRTLGRRRY